MTCLFESSTCFEQPCAHPQEDKCINKTSGIITLCYWLPGIQVKMELPAVEDSNKHIIEVTVSQIGYLPELPVFFTTHHSCQSMYKHHKYVRVLTVSTNHI
jgi:hypothetical protein